MLIYNETLLRFDYLHFMFLEKVLRRIPLWYFLHEMLCMDTDSQLVCWTDKKNLIFQIRHPEELASLWGSVKGKSEMTYSKLARGLRYYYGKGVIEKVSC